MDKSVLIPIKESNGTYSFVKKQVSELTMQEQAFHVGVQMIDKYDPDRDSKIKKLSDVLTEAQTV